MKTHKQKCKALHAADVVVSSALLLLLGTAAVFQMSRGGSFLPVLAVLALCLAINGVVKFLLARMTGKTMYFYVNLLDSIPFMLHCTDLDMNWLFMNKPTMDFLGLDRDKVAGEHCSRWNASICNTDRCSAHRLRNGDSTTFFQQNGLELRVDTNWTRDSRGERSGYVELVQDVTEMVSLQRQSNLVRDIREVCSTFVDAAHSIAQGAQTVARGSISQEASVEALSACFDEMDGHMAHSLEQIEGLIRLSESILTDAEAGGAHMRKLNTAVKEITEASQSIMKVIQVIEDIAFQTNILALNAAVEAARAGQYGRGFSVVAEEVRALAAKSSAAAKDTGILIEDTIRKTRLGLEISGETAAALEKINAEVMKGNQMVEDIARSTHDQHTAVRNIRENVESVSQVARQNSGAAQESASASEEMSSQVQELRGLLDRFQEGMHTGTAMAGAEHTAMALEPVGL